MARILAVILVLVVGIGVWTARATDPIPAPLPAMEQGDEVYVTVVRNSKPIGSMRLIVGGTWSLPPPTPPSKLDPANPRIKQ